MTFQRVIQFELRELTWDKVLAYIDDVIILGKDFEEHLKNLELTFERFRKHNLKLDKLFGECSVDGNEHIIPDDLVKLNELDKLEETPLPETHDTPGTLPHLNSCCRLWGNKILNHSLCIQCESMFKGHLSSLLQRCRVDSILAEVGVVVTTVEEALPAIKGQPWQGSALL